MADVASNLRTYLVGKSGVTNILSTRIYVDHVHEDITIEYPYAIIRTVDEVPDYAHDGALLPTGLYQIDVYSDSKTTAVTGATAIQTELSGTRGTVSGITAGHIFATRMADDYDTDIRIFRRSTDYEVGQNG
jgi:hypothetical protein